MKKTCSMCEKGKRCKECNKSYRRNKGYDKYSKRAEYFSSYQKELRKTEKNQQYEKEFRSSYRKSFAGTVTDLLCGARYRAKKKGLDTDLDRDWVEEHLRLMKCEATGVELILEVNEGVSHTAFRPFIDRKDNQRGYTKDNCRVVSVIFNKAKSEYNDEDVLKMAQGLINQGGLK